eukprot:391786-Amphidinium_carterae.1
MEATLSACTYLRDSSSLIALRESTAVCVCVCVCELDCSTSRMCPRGCGNVFKLLSEPMLEDVQAAVNLRKSLYKL